MGEKGEKKKVEHKGMTTRDNRRIKKGENRKMGR